MFRRDVVNGQPLYQVNYNLTGRSFAKVLDRNDLEEFLGGAAALSHDVVEEAVREVDNSGKAHILDVEISAGEVISHGMVATPSDF